MNVSSPDPMKDGVETQARSGRCGNAGDYVRDLIRRDQQHTSRLSELRRIVDEADAGGVGTRSLAEILTAPRRRAADREANSYQLSRGLSTTSTCTRGDILEAGRLTLMPPNRARL